MVSVIEPVDLDVAGTGGKGPRRGLWFALGILLVAVLVAMVFLLRPGGEETQVVEEAVPVVEADATATNEVDEGIVVMVTPTPVPPATWEFRSEPEGARVMVAGQFVGVTPVSAKLLQFGSITALVQKAGMQAVVLDWHARSGALTNSVITLEPLMGAVRLDQWQTGAELRIEGAVVEVPESRVLDMPVLEQEWVVSREGYLAITNQITPQAGKERIFVLDWKAVPPPKLPGAEVRASLGGIPMKNLQVKGETFVMGSVRGEQGRSSNEGLLTVRFTRAVWMAEREVSNAEFRKFHSSHTSGTLRGINLNAGTQAVVRVTWEQAAAYCNWLSRQEGLPMAYEKTEAGYQLIVPVTTGVRLPTEAEWEWAASEGDAERRYPWGNGFPPPKGSGNLADQQARSVFSDVIPAYADGQRVSGPVGQSNPNRFGLRDLAGNVAEWVTDGYEPRLAGGAARDDYTGKVGGGGYHVIKGSSFQTASLSDLRIARRDYGNQAQRDVGFRICRTVE